MSELQEAYNSRAAGMAYLANEIVFCALDGEEILYPLAVWNDELKLVYCTQEELETDKEILLSRKFEVEDTLLGYIEDCND